MSDLLDRFLVIALVLCGLFGLWLSFLLFGGL